MQSLPIDSRLPEIVQALRESPALVLVAEPGAGKTTRVPRALLDAGFADKGEILVLEPRRLATRMAARRVAEELGEKVGERIGFQVRFEDVSSARTRVRFLTEGILGRRLGSDPTLRGVAVVVLDEFHERSVHADIALALLRRLQRGARPDLRVVVMSATLDADVVARYLGASVLRVEGRRFDVEIEHAEKRDERHLDHQVASAVRKLVARGLEGDVLVFLPGAAEIRRAREACDEIARSAGLDLVMLHGDLPPAEQDRAVRTGPRRKVILSTNVAETSITIEGVAAVIDSGLARIAGHSPWSGMPTLETKPICQASATQRAGRAGRVRAGVCLRLYTKPDHDSRPAHDVPEIRRVDLAETTLLLRASGERNLAEFGWLDAPPAAAIDAADVLLARLGAIDSSGAPTERGRRMLSMPLHPRAARLVVEAVERRVGARGALLAALLGEREIRIHARNTVGGRGATTDEVGTSDAIARLEAFETVEALGMGADRIRAHDLDVGATLAVSRARDQLARIAGVRGGVEASLHDEETALLMATLAAFPDRVARRRAATGADVVFAGGGSATLAPTSVVKEARFLVAVDADERRGQTTVRLASAVEPDWLLELFPERVVSRRDVRFDAAAERVVVSEQLVYDGLVLDETRSTTATGPDVERALEEAAFSRGAGAFCDPDELERLRRRVRFAAQHVPSIVPIDDDVLRHAMRELCTGRRSFAELREGSLLDLLRARLGAHLATLDRVAPERVTLPGGRRVAVEYEDDKPPWIASRLQDFFGMADGPSVAERRVPLVLHLLAPNQRAVQVTTDLAGFWDRHYPAIRRELMRRYPRHSWPEDPRNATPPAPTRRR